MESQKAPYLKKLGFMLAAAPLAVLVFALYGLLQFERIPATWKGWLFLIFVVTPCGFLIELGGEIVPKMARYRYLGRFAPYFFLALLVAISISIALFLPQSVKDWLDLNFR